MKSRGTFMTAAAALSVALAFTGCDASATLPAETPAATDTPTVQATMDETQATVAGTDESFASAAVSTDSPASSEAVTDDALPAPDPQYMTLALTGPITEIDREQDIVYVSEQGTADSAAAPDPANSVGAVQVDGCMLIDAQTGLEVDDDALQPGEQVTAYIGLAMSRSIPPQSACSAIITNMPTDGTSTAYVRAQEVTQNTDGIRVLNQNADMYVVIPQDLEVEVFGEPGQTVPASSIQPGSRMVVWYGMTTRSIPPQAVATKVVVDTGD